MSCERINQLEAEVQQANTRAAALEARLDRLQAPDTTTRPSAAEANATVTQVLKDADSRTAISAVGSDSAGWENGFYIRTADGSFTLKPGLLLQFRHITNYRDGGVGTADESDLESGFEVTRAKLIMEGNVFGKDIGYKFQWASSRNGGATSIEDAFVTYKLNPTWTLKAGQFKDPVHHEELTGDSMQLAVDRSLANQLLGGGAVGPRIQGGGADVRRCE